MSLLHCSSLRLPSIPFFPHSSSPPYSRNFFCITKNQNARRFSSCCLQLRALPIIDQELLRILCESDDSTGKARTNLPAVRSYETDLASFTLIGSVSFDQALIAAAADGGEAADEHLAAGTSTMVVETVFPSGPDEHSTVSTRLFLPAEMVKERAKKLRNSFARNIIDKGTVSKNILAMTFRQVVVQQLWSFQLALFYPGAERNMEDLGNPREAQAGFVVNSSDESFISSLAEVVSFCALESAKSNYIQEAGGLHAKYALHWFQMPPKNSVDSFISICRISESEVAEEARNQVETYKLMKGKYVNRSKKVKYTWWPTPDYSSLDLIGGPGFGSWTCEFIPAYKLKINTSIFKDLKLEGCHNVSDNRHPARIKESAVNTILEIVRGHLQQWRVIESDVRRMWKGIKKIITTSRAKYNCNAAPTPRNNSRREKTDAGDCAKQTHAKTVIQIIIQHIYWKGLKKKERKKLVINWKEIE